MSFMEPNICTISVIIDYLIDKGANYSTFEQELILVDRHFFPQDVKRNAEFWLLILIVILV